ncbi:hypothetical protein BJ741DRAFT_653958 [Chytriomyces cf. hyalinus JEL632]|nr:hypothetical protein BJ741DRAFT_653958 [Chytriomyces cf. hyalinus JEL632]
MYLQRHNTVHQQQLGWNPSAVNSHASTSLAANPCPANATKSANDPLSNTLNINALTPILMQPILMQPILMQPILMQPILMQPILMQPILMQPILMQPILLYQKRKSEIEKAEGISKKEEARKRRELKRRERDHEKRLRDERTARKRQEAAEEAARKVKRFKWTEEASLEVAAVYVQLKDEQLTLEQNKIGFTSFVKHVETNLSQRKTIKDKCKQTGGGGFADSLDKHGISHQLFTAFDDSYDDEADDTSGYASDHSAVSNMQQPCENLVNSIELHESDLPFNDDSDMSSGKLFDTNLSSASGIQRIDGTSTEVSGVGNLVAQRPDALVRPRALTAGASQKSKAKANDADSTSSTANSSYQETMLLQMMFEMRWSDEQRRELAELRAEERRQKQEEQEEERRLIRDAQSQEREEKKEAREA